MKRPAEHQVLPGIVVDTGGEVSVDSVAGKFLFDAALELEDAVPQPVDVEHVLAAIVLASREGRFEATTKTGTSNHELMEVLREYLPVVLRRYGSGFGRDND